MKLFFLLSFFITFVMSTVDNVVSARDDVGVGADWNTGESISRVHMGIPVD
jgi:hypothetical protein